MKTILAVLVLSVFTFSCAVRTKTRTTAKVETMSLKKADAKNG